MNDITAAIGAGQLERIDEITLKRKIGEMFLEATKGYDWFIPQTIPKDCTHSYYA